MYDRRMSRIFPVTTISLYLQEMTLGYPMKREQHDDEDCLPFRNTRGNSKNPKNPDIIDDVVQVNLSIYLKL